ncbi:MAG: hypothetical protein KBT03_11060 [Bacteroidales bacterium]|nr:hypothetical protein [Candidatus Scybalousia scybalohippi]
MIIIRNKILPSKEFVSLTLWPFCFVREDRINLFSNRCKEHANIHAEQQKELLFIGFYILYIMYYIRGLYRGYAFHEAYVRNPFEMEAFEYEWSPSARIKYGWLKYDI